MPIENDKLASDLTQIKGLPEKSVEDIEHLRETAIQSELADLERIQRDVRSTIPDIESMSENAESAMKADEREQTRRSARP